MLEAEAETEAAAMELLPRLTLLLLLWRREGVGWVGPVRIAVAVLGAVAGAVVEAAVVLVVADEFRLVVDSAVSFMLLLLLLL